MFLITRRRRTDGRTDGEEEKSVSDAAAASAAEMYISDVQEDDLEIAIKVSDRDAQTLVAPSDSGGINVGSVKFQRIDNNDHM